MPKRDQGRHNPTLVQLYRYTCTVQSVVGLYHCVPKHVCTYVRMYVPNSVEAAEVF